MTTAQDLLQAQCARLVELDPELPSTFALPGGGDPLMARVPGGGSVAGLVTRSQFPPGSQNRLWSAADTFELFPLLGEHGGPGMDALLHAWKDRVREIGAPDEDSSCLVTWPSRDVAATRALLDHGFVPLSVLAVRSASRGGAEQNAKLPGTVKARRAGPVDLDAVVELGLAELDYAAQVGASVRRSDAPELKRNAARLRLAAAGDPVWLAERDGVPIGLAECGWVDTTGPRGPHRLRAGRWAYVNCVSIAESARGTGVGTALVSLAHAEFARAGVVGSFLYYNPPNPLSSVFWPRQGYRPLWTMWEVRPASALR
jgi:GNAT superfamily N-acetyltransferase